MNAVSWMLGLSVGLGLGGALTQCPPTPVPVVVHQARIAPAMHCADPLAEINRRLRAHGPQPPAPVY